MKRILVYNSGGGLGDSIQIIPLMLSLKNHFRKSKILYLGAHENHFKGKLKEYNIDVETFDLNLKSQIVSGDFTVRRISLLLYWYFFKKESKSSWQLILAKSI